MTTLHRLALGALLLASAACERPPTSPALAPEPFGAPGGPAFAYSGDTLFTTDFGEYETGEQPSGWTQMWDATPFFAVADEPGATGGKVLQWSATGQSRNRWALAFDGFGDTQDQRVYTEFRVRSLGGGASTYYMGAAAVRVAGTASDEQGYALFFVGVPSTGVNALVLSTWSGGGYVQLGSQSYPWTLDAWYSVRLEAVGSSIRARVWPRGTPEPAEWNLSASDTRYTTGRPGVSHHDNGTVQWDVWEVAADPPAPAPPPPGGGVAYQFTEGPAWVLPSAWSETSSPGSSEWTVAADLGVADGRALRNTNTSTGRHILRLNSVPDTAGDQEVLVKLRMADGDGRGPGIALRHTMNGALETAYVAYFRPDGNLVEINRFLNGAWSYLGSTSFPNDPGAWYWMRFRAEGIGLKVRVWPDGAPEPASWTLVVSDTGIGAGSAGAYTYEPNTVDFDVFAYVPNGGTAAAPAPGPAPVLSRVILNPATALALKGGTVQFRAHGRATNGDSLVLPIAWTATGGTVSANGLYTAGTTAGSFRVFATHQGGTKSDTSTVSILNSPGGGATSFSTTFAAYALGAAPFDWTVTSAPANVAWTVEADATASDGVALRGVSSATGRHILRSDAIGSAGADQEVLAKVKMTDADDRGPGVALRHTMSGTSETAYVAYFRPGINQVEVNRFVGGAWGYVGALAFANDPGEWYWIRFRAEGTTLKVRAWAHGTPEPAAWGVTLTDASIATGGVGAYVYEPNTVLFDAFSATRGTGSAPTP